MNETSADPSYYKMCSSLHTHTLGLFHSRSHTLRSLSQHSAPPSHYLLVKPMPELGGETKRHWADYFWKHPCRRHFIHPTRENATSWCVRQLTGYTIQIIVITGARVFSMNYCKTRKSFWHLPLKTFMKRVFLSPRLNNNRVDVSVSLGRINLQDGQTLPWCRYAAGTEPGL